MADEGIYLLKLFVTGMTPGSQALIEHLRQTLDQDFAGRYTLQVINVFKEPDVVELHGVFATPTLIRELPPPIRRLVGDLRDKERVLAGLELV